MIRGGEYHQAVLEIKVAGPDLWSGNPTLLGVVKFHDTPATNAGAIAGFCRNARQQFIGDAGGNAPTRTFVSRHSTELAIVPAAAQRTTLGGVARWRAGGSMTDVSHAN
jgi:hypothetical protein